MAPRLRKPDFLIVGAPRCATTSMWAYLMQHPGIFVPARKEVHFFGSDLLKKPSPYFIFDEREYLLLFAEAGDDQITGESSVMYLYSRNAAREIKQFHPTAKPIIMLRDPVEVMHSYHAHLLWAAHEDVQDFAEALAAEPERKRGRRIPSTVLFPDELYYRDIVRFTDQVKRYFDTFGRENVHVVIHDDMKADVASVYRKTLEFLQVDPEFAPDFEQLNRHRRVRMRRLARLVQNPPGFVRPLLETLSKRLLFSLRTKIDDRNSKYVQRPAMPPELRRQLSREFAPEVERLSKLLDRDLTHWSKRGSAEGGGVAARRRASGRPAPSADATAAGPARSDDAK